MGTVTTEQLKAKREALTADLYALQGALQILDNLIEMSETATLDDLREAVGAQSVEVMK